MDIQNIIGRNIQLMREKMGLNQDALADYLGIKNRVMISYYETGAREIPVEHLNKLADLFGVDLYDLMEENPDIINANVAFAFRADQLNGNDFESIAQFRRIVKNYLKIADLEKDR